MSGFQETVFLRGHIIDSLILAKVLDRIVMMGGTFDMQDVKIGTTRDAPSQARIVVHAPSSRILSEILRAIQPPWRRDRARRRLPVFPRPGKGCVSRRVLRDDALAHANSA